MTDWGPLAEKFLVDDIANSYDVIGFSEHHLPSAKLQIFHHVCKTTFRRKFIASAKPKNNGTSGGVLLAPKNHLSIAPIANCNGLFHVGEDWVAFSLRLRGIDIIVVQLYLISGMGPKQDNLLRLGKIFTFLLSKRLLFVIFGDFNMVPEQLYSTGFIAKSSACIIPAPTCRTGRCLDYIVTSKAFAPAISNLQFIAKAPWKMHDTIGFDILRAPPRGPS